MLLRRKPPDREVIKVRKTHGSGQDARTLFRLQRIPILNVTLAESVYS